MGKKMIDVHTVNKKKPNKKKINKQTKKLRFLQRFFAEEKNDWYAHCKQNKKQRN